MEECVSILTMALRINLDKVDAVNTQNIQIGVENTMTMTLIQIKCAVHVAGGKMVIVAEYSKNQYMIYSISFLLIF